MDYKCSNPTPWVIETHKIAIDWLKPYDLTNVALTHANATFHGPKLHKKNFHESRTHGKILIYIYILQVKS